MSDRKITIMEYHSHGDGPRLFPDLFERGTAESEETDESETSEAEDSGGRGLGPIIALGLLIALAVGYRYYQSEDEPADYDSEQVEVTEYEN